MYFRKKRGHNHKDFFKFKYPKGCAFEHKKRSFRASSKRKLGLSRAMALVIMLVLTVVPATLIYNNTRSKTQTVRANSTAISEIQLYSPDDVWTKVRYDRPRQDFSAPQNLRDRYQLASRGALPRSTPTPTPTPTTAPTASTSTPRPTQSAIVVENVQPADSNMSPTELQEAIVSYAKSFIGVPYRYGGNSPKTGFDCSGFTTYVYNHFGYKINRTADNQLYNGVSVSRDNLQKGDLVLFGSSIKNITHVGIYIGGGQFIHAPQTGDHVKITSLSDGYYNGRFVAARRIVQQETAPQE